MIDRIRLVALLALLWSPAGLAQQTFTESTSLFEAIRQISTIYFDVEARTNDITICGMDLLLGSEQVLAVPLTATIQIYSRTGTALGAEGSPAGWTTNFSATGCGFISGGPNTRKLVELTTPIFIPANSAAGICIYVEITAGDVGGLLCKVDTSGPAGAVFHTGPDLRVRTGTGQFTAQGPFPDLITHPLLFLANRFAGTFYYALGNNCSNVFVLPTVTAGPDLFDGPGGGGPFRSGCVTVIQGGIGGLARVPAGQTLTVEPGAIVKPMPGVRVSVQGTCNMEGARWTSFSDDSLGGDSNNDGAATTPSLGDWDSIVWTSASDGSVETSSFSYAGGGGIFGSAASVMDFQSADIPVTGCRFTDNASVGTYVLDFNGNSVPPECRGNLIDNNGGGAIGNVPASALGAFRDNATANNGSVNGVDGNLLHASGQTVTSCAGGPLDIQNNVEVDARSFPEGIVVVRGRICISNGGRLVLGPDTKVKFDPTVRSGIEVQPTGTLEIRGTPSREVCITSLPDDEVGGDSDLNGPTVGAPGEIEGIKYTGSIFGGGPLGCIESTFIRYAGANNSPGLEVDGPAVVLDGVLVERGLGDGFCIEQVARAVNLAALNNGGTGIHAGGNNATHDLEHASSRGNGGPGVSAHPGWNGEVRSTNSWDNAGSNIDTGTIDPLRVRNSNGMDPALGSPTAGNLDVDPQWLSLDGVELAATSPLRDAAAQNPLSRAYDLNGGSAVNGGAPDIGAAEISTSRLEVSGRLEQGKSIILEVIPPTGNPGFLAVSLNPQTTVVPGLGTLAGGLSLDDYLLLGPFTAPTTVPLPIPDDPCVDLDGIPVSFQGFGPGSSGGIEMTNAWIGTIIGRPVASACNGL